MTESQAGPWVVTYYDPYSDDEYITMTYYRDFEKAKAFVTAENEILLKKKNADINRQYERLSTLNREYEALQKAGLRPVSESFNPLFPLPEEVSELGEGDERYELSAMEFEDDE